MMIGGNEGFYEGRPLPPSAISQAGGQTDETPENGQRAREGDEV